MIRMTPSIWAATAYKMNPLGIEDVRGLTLTSRLKRKERTT